MQSDTASLSGVLQTKLQCYSCAVLLRWINVHVQVERLLERENEEDIPFFWFHSPREACVSRQ